MCYLGVRLRSHLDDFLGDYSAGHCAVFFGVRNSNGRASTPLADALVAPLAASLMIQIEISRAGEFEADRGGAEICSDHKALAGALAKIDAYARGLQMTPAEVRPETAQTIVINYLLAVELPICSAPQPTEKRVARLHATAES